MIQESDEKREEGSSESEPTEPARKERVIHTRVPAVLERELKRMASALRMPVSNVVRAILEDAVEAVDRVGRKAEGEVRGIAESLAHNRDRFRGLALGSEAEGESGPPAPRARATKREGAAQEKLVGIIGFQPLVLAQPAECAVCSHKLRAGEQAYLGVRTGKGPAVIIGQECLPAQTSTNETKSQP